MMARAPAGARIGEASAMDVLFTIAMLGLMVGALALAGRFWPHSSRSGGFRAGRGHGAGDGATRPNPEPPIPEDDDASWRWPDGQAPGDGER